jgi:hypothetical protein
MKRIFAPYALSGGLSLGCQVVWRALTVAATEELAR